MIRISSLELPVHHNEEVLEKKILALLGIRKKDLISFTVVKKSLDVRKKENIRYSYMIDANVKDEGIILKKIRNASVSTFTPHPYTIPGRGNRPLRHRPVIIGAGPAGLFAGLLLAKSGYCPLILERGEEAVKRAVTVRKFWEDGILDPDSNVTFGEGGAGTFSDGKLNTLVKDEAGRNSEVLKTFVGFGADSEILILQKPHIGTDRLIGIITNLRKEIERLGGTVKFRCRAESFLSENGRVTGIRTDSGETIACEVLIFAGGHSARDTIRRFHTQGIVMEAKPFAVGLRVQHPQHMIDLSQFGPAEAEFLSPASYRLAAKASDGRGVYTFCMCPGGYVVNASCEKGFLSVNGMSYHGRAGVNANSAVIVTVSPSDFPSEDPLSGIEFQERMERKAFQAGEGRIPVQLYEDFKNGQISTKWGDVEPCFKGETAFADLNGILPTELCRSIKEGMESFGNKISGFNRPDAVLAGVESRTSSPVKIPRNENMEAGTEGFYPCGEGAGYAGGITSAAMDGMKTAEQIIRTYGLPSD